MNGRIAKRLRKEIYCGGAYHNTKQVDVIENMFKKIKRFFWFKGKKKETDDSIKTPEFQLVSRRVKIKSSELKRRYRQAKKLYMKGLKA